MQTKRIATILRQAQGAVVVTVVIALTLVLATSSTVAGPPVEGGSAGITLAGAVASKISYQGRLTDAGGNPLDGNYNLVFQLWDHPEAGSQVSGDIVRNSVPVSNGLFTVDLDVPQDAFNGQALWLRIQVNGQWLSPRQELLPVPYALSLKPGAAMRASIYDGPVLEVENTDANPAGGGHAIVGKNASGYTWRPAIYGENTGASAGVYGRSDGWHATVGWQAGNNPDHAGVYGYNGGAGPGVMGEGPKGVYGRSSADYGEGVHGHGSGSNTEGVLGTSDQNVGIYGISGGTSGNAFGVWGQTDATWGFFTYQQLYAGGGCTGCTIAFVGQNGDSSSLEVGDVVVISGVAPPLKGQETPVLVVQRATADGGALGVVQARAVVALGEMLTSISDTTKKETIEVPGLAAGNVSPGDYLFVVVQGLVQVRADASTSAIEVGNLVGSGSAAGLAQKLDPDAPGAPALGRALEPLDKGTGLIWVLVLGR